MKVRWKQGYRPKIDAETAYNALEELRKKHGKLTADIVVEAAKDKNNPLHTVFIWDVNEAARKYWQEQARLLMRSIEVIYDDAPSTSVRAYEVVETTNDNRARQSVYMTTHDILSDPQLRQQLLQRAIREAISYKQKYKALVELSSIFGAIDSVVSMFDQ